MVTVVTREANGIPLTHQQVDDNFTGLASAVNNIGADILAPAIAAKNEAIAAASAAQGSASSAANSANAASISRGNAAASAESAAASAIESAASVTALLPPSGASRIGADDATGGSLFTTVAGFISRIMSSAGADVAGFIQNITGAVKTTIAAQLRLHLSGIDFGARFNLVNDDTSFIQNAIDKALPNEEIFIGQARCLGKLNVTRPITLVGSDARNANVPDFNFSSSVLLFSNGSNGGIIGNNNVTLKNIVVISYSDYGVDLVDGSLMTENVVIQGGVESGIRIKNGYYNKFVNTRLEGGLRFGAKFDNCYNINAVGLTVRGAPNSLELINGSVMSMHGGSLEDFDPSSYGYTLRGASSISFFGTYFEGKVIEGVGGRCGSLGAFSQVTAIGCQVYLSTMAQWMAAEDSSAIGVRVFSRNNKFIWPTDAFVTESYSLLSSDPLGQCDISGDNWVSDSGAAPGPNCKYMGDLFTSGAGPVQNVGNYEVCYPPGHPLFGRNINTRPICASLSNTTPTVLPGTFINFGNNGEGTDDPLGLHTGGWGYNSYQAVFQNGRWEKIGLRLPLQLDITTPNATDLASVIALANANKAAINTLFAGLRNSGSMPSV